MPQKHVGVINAEVGDEDPMVTTCNAPGSNAIGGRESEIA